MRRVTLRVYVRTGAPLRRRGGHRLSSRCYVVDTNVDRSKLQQIRAAQLIPFITSPFPSLLVRRPAFFRLENLSVARRQAHFVNGPSLAVSGNMSQLAKTPPLQALQSLHRKSKGELYPQMTCHRRLWFQSSASGRYSSLEADCSSPQRIHSIVRVAGSCCPSLPSCSAPVFPSFSLGHHCSGASSG